MKEPNAALMFGITAVVLVSAATPWFLYTKLSMWIVLIGEQMVMNLGGTDELNLVLHHLATMLLGTSIFLSPALIIWASMRIKVRVFVHLRCSLGPASTLRA